jgi:hypothetical protein
VKSVRIIPEGLICHAICPSQWRRHSSSGDRSRARTSPTIVFANSLGTDFRIWRDVIVRMVGDYSIICFTTSAVTACPNWAMADHHG